MDCMNMKELFIPIKRVKLKSVVVLFENCLVDVPINPPDKDNKKDQPSIYAKENPVSNTTHATHKVVVEPFINCQNDSSSILDTNQSDKETELCFDQAECVPQKLSVEESLLVQLPIPTKTDNDEVAKGTIIPDNSDLCWESLNEPLESPLTSLNSSVVDVELTPPCSAASDDLNFFNDRSPFEGSVLVNFDTLPDEIDKVKVDQQTTKRNVKTKGQKSLLKEVQVNVESFEPTLCQLQVLWGQSKTLETSIHTKRCLRPRSILKQFTPCTPQQPETCQNNCRNKQTGQITRQNTKNIFVLKNKKSNAKRKLRKKLGRKNEVMQIRKVMLTPKQKMVLEKKQLKLALSLKKKASRSRNKLDNALGSINRRICNQNTLWRMLSRP